MMTPEQALLGAMLSGVDFGDLSAIVQARDFTQPNHEMIWDGAARVYEAGGRPDPHTVRAAIGPEVKRLPDGPLYLATLMANCPSLGMARQYAQQVSDAAWRDRMRLGAVKLGQLAESERDRAEVLEDARQVVDAMSDVKADAVTFADSLQEVIEAADSGGTAYASTPWPDLDRIIRGLAPGRLYIVGARPGTGKSLCGGNIAARVAQRGQAALIASMEMSHAEVTQRMLACEAKVNLSAIEAGNLDGDDWNAISHAHTSMAEWQVEISDSSSQTVATIRARVRDLARSSDLGVVVVDYIQLLNARDDKANRAEQVAEMSRGLKQVAREFNVPVVAMAQLNREQTRANRRPTMADLRESGGIEQDADVIILLNRPDQALPDVEALVVKNRSGSLGECLLSLQGHYARLVAGVKGWAS